MLWRGAALLAAALVATALAWVPLGAAPAAAAATVTTGLGGYGDLVVDSAHQRLFASGAPAVAGGPGVVTTTISGGSPQPVAGATATGAMAMSPDGSTVYVVGDKDVQAIATADLSVQDFPVADAGCLSDIAATTGEIWFTYSCDAMHNPATGIGAIAVADGSVQINRQPAGMTGYLYLDSVPEAPSTIAVLATDQGRTTLAMLTAAGDTLTAGPSTSLGTIYGDAVALNADASKVLAGGSGTVQEYATADLSVRLRAIALDTPDSPQGQPTQGSASSVAFSPDGSLIALTGGFGEIRGSTSYAYGAVVRTYREATGGLVRQYDYRDNYTDQDIVNNAPRHSLQFVGSTLWATFMNYLGERPTSHLLTDAAQSLSTLTASAPRSVTRAKPLAVTGQLSSAGTGVGVATLTVHKTDLDGTHLLPAVKTSSSGAFTIHDTPAAGGANTYTISYAGDATHGAVSRQISVTVSRLTPAVSVTTDRTSYITGQTVRITAHLSATYRNRTLSIWAAAYPGKYTLLRQAAVDSHGNLRISYRTVSRFNVNVSFGGDARYGPRSVTVSRSVAGRVTVAVTGAYGRSGSYHLFHYSSGGTLAGAARPARLEHYVTFQLQVLYQGAWRAADTETFDTNAAGSTGPISIHAAKKYAFRVRVSLGPSYVNSTIVVTPASSTWYYLKFS